MFSSELPPLPEEANISMPALFALLIALCNVTELPFLPKLMLIIFTFFSIAQSIAFTTLSIDALLLLSSIFAEYISIFGLIPLIEPFSPLDPITDATAVP